MQQVSPDDHLGTGGQRSSMCSDGNSLEKEVRGSKGSMAESSGWATMTGERTLDRPTAEAYAAPRMPTRPLESGARMERVVVPPGDVRTSVCPVCSRVIPPGTGLTFMRRDNRIHQTCLTEAQRRAERPPVAAVHVDPADHARR